MPRTQFHEPLIQEEQKAMEIRGFPILITGTYVLLDDVTTALRAYAQSLDDPEMGAAVHDAATWLQGERHVTEIREIEVPDEGRVEFTLEEVDPADRTPDVARIEIFPDPPDDPRPKWYARSIDTGGFVLKTTNGSFDQEYVIKNAQDRWPGVEIHLLKSAGEDSMWQENLTQTQGHMKSTRGTFPSVGPPHRRLWT